MGETIVNANFSLHDDFADMKQFIIKVNPEVALIVHCDSQTAPGNRTIEDELQYDPDCRTGFIFPTEGIPRTL